MSWLPQRSLRTTLVLVFLVLGLSPLIGVGVVGYQVAEASLTAAAANRLADVSHSAIDKLDRNLFERYGDVQAFARSDAARSMDPARITTWMNTMLATYTPIYSLMVVADRQGRIIAVTTTTLDGKPLPASQALLGRDVSGEPWFRATLGGQIKDGASLVEDLQPDALLGTVYGTVDGADLAMRFSAPIKDSSGAIVGVWSNRFNWAVAKTILSEVEGRARQTGMATVRLALANQGRTILAGPEATQVLRGSLTSRESLKQATARQEGRGLGLGLSSGQPALETAAVSSGYSTYAGLGWAVIATQDTAEAIASANQLRLIALAIGLGAAALIVLAAWTIASFLAQRVAAVAAAAQQLATQDLPALATAIRAMRLSDFSQEAQIQTRHLAVTGQDEVGLMARNFNQMISQLQEVAATTRSMGDNMQFIMEQRKKRGTERAGATGD